MDLDVTEGTKFRTTVGRIIFNRQCLPKITHTSTTRWLSLLSVFWSTIAATVTQWLMLDQFWINIKKTGFHYATLAGPDRFCFGTLCSTQATAASGRHRTALTRSNEIATRTASFRASVVELCAWTSAPTLVQMLGLCREQPNLHDG